MSELVDKVHTAIRDAEGGTDKAEARAAIAAVAEWLDNSNTLDNDSKVSLALRAAAGSALEAKP